MSDSFNKLPEKGLPRKDILKMMKTFAADDADYRTGKTWSLVYHLNDEHTDFLKKAYTSFFSENGLNPMAFLSLKRFETEVIRMTASMLHGDADTVGTITSGGTESCLMAVKTYRDLARDKRFFVGTPEMIVPETVHMAFEKGAHYFGVKAVHAPVGKDKRVDVKAVKKLINRNTILLVGSAPCYPFGVVDPIEELGELALKKNIPLHVDSCLGGYLLPFVEKLGYPVPPFDFRVPGVTSISADTHKYGFAAKGASTITYRNIDILKYQMFVFTDWPGGVFASPALLGTRPGGSIAAAWAAMVALGEDGYLETARQIMDTTKTLMDGINAIPGLAVVARPHMSVFAFRSVDRDLNVYCVADQMEKRGWHIDRQQKPDCLHNMVTTQHTKIADVYLNDLRESVEYVRQNPGLAEEGNAAMYGMIAHVPMRGLIKKEVLKIFLEMYGPDAKMPDLGSSASGDDLTTKLGMKFVEYKKKLTNRLNDLLGIEPE
ncbi:MAG TPA: aspartate aminotransferase family protein [bacterium]|nr:aspartate aminotransferase family protein [bacterium]